MSQLRPHASAADATYKGQEAAIEVWADTLVRVALFAGGVLDDLGAVLQNTWPWLRPSHEERREGLLGDFECLCEERNELVAQLLDLLEVAEVRRLEPREGFFLWPLRSKQGTVSSTHPVRRWIEQTCEGPQSLT